MNPAQHTPGPWILSNDGETILAHRAEGRMSDIVEIAAMDPVGDVADGDPDISAANAALIAAAPDLLSALEGLVEAVDSEDAWPESTLDNAKAVIIRARGGVR